MLEERKSRKVGQTILNLGKLQTELHNANYFMQPNLLKKLS